MGVQEEEPLWQRCRSKSPSITTGLVGVPSNCQEKPIASDHNLTQQVLELDNSKKNNIIQDFALIYNLGGAIKKAINKAQKYIPVHL